MIYLTSDLHGAFQAYQKCKQLVGFSNNDELYILGDILDGNTRYPENCLKILDDVMKRDNIHLILGDREYYHVAYQYSKHEFFEKCLLEKKKTNALLEYMKTLPEAEQNRYYSYLGEQNVSELIQYEGHFFYLVHGAPCVFEGEEEDWEFDQVSSLIDFETDYMEAILSDPTIDCPPQMNEQNTYVVCGHIPTRYVYDTLPLLKEKAYQDCSAEKPLKQSVIRKSHRILLDCGCSGDVLGRSQEGWMANCAFVGLEKDGLSVQYVL